MRASLIIAPMVSYAAFYSSRFPAPAGGPRFSWSIGMAGRVAWIATRSTSNAREGTCADETLLRHCRGVSRGRVRGRIALERHRGAGVAQVILAKRCPRCTLVLELRASREHWQTHFACWRCEVIYCLDGLVLIECARPLEHLETVPLWAQRKYGKKPKPTPPLRAHDARPA